ncbi:MAG: flagellar hook-associated protein FlgK [Verrucomicrobiota bacterium]|nr:flagellar hook-associated protein FlgK [Verrucomicrobiota bacterium]
MSGLGIMGTMEMARNAMRVARSGAEVSGNNLANASNPIYARQRIKIDSAVTIPTEKGPQGSGAAVARLEQIRDKVLDAAVIYENSITGYHEGKLAYLQQAENALGQTVDSQTIDAGGAYGTYGISEGMTELFSSFQSLSVSPTSISERQTVISNAKKISTKLRTVDERLSRLRTAINEEVKDTITQVNNKIKEVAYVAINIGNIEVVEGSANEVRDSLQYSMEQLSKYGEIKTTYNENGELTLKINDHEMITDNVMTNSINAKADANGMYYMYEGNDGKIVNTTSGRIKGMIDVRDQSVKDLREDIDAMTGQLITEVNALHQTGYDLDGVNDSSSGLFEGTGAADIKVNETIADNPRKLQGSSSADETSNNDILRSIANLGSKGIAGLNSVSFSEYYSNTLSRFGHDVALTTSQLNDQKTVEKLLIRQRESIMGVSIDEEVANLVVYQRAFQASAKLLTTMDGLMQDVLNMTR